MNCSYIHSVHGCSAQLAWSFCTEVFFTRIYRKEQRSAAERSDNDPSSKPNPTIRNRIFNFGNIFSKNDNDNNRPETPSARIPIPMNPLRRSHSFSHLRKDTVSTCPNRLQAQLDRALAAFQPYPPGMSGSPLPPDYVNDRRVSSPLDATRRAPSAPVTTGEVARAGILTDSLLLLFRLINLLRLLRRKILQLFPLGNPLKIVGRQVTIRHRSLVVNDYQS